MVETKKKLGNMIATAVNLDNDVDDSAATITYNADDSKPLPEIPPPNQSQSKEQSASDQENEEKRVLGETKQVTSISETMKDGQRLEITIERQVQIPASLADQVNVVFPSLADDTKDVLAVDSAQTVPDMESLNEDHQQHGFHHSKASNPELYTDIPKEVTPEMKSLQQEVTGQVREIGGGSYLHPKKIVEIPPELSQQMRTLHEDLNKEVARGAELLHPKEIVEIPKELSQDIRGLRGALNRELKNGVDVLHPKEIVQIPTELSLEIRRLHKELNSEFKSAANVLQPKEIAEIPSELGQEAQDLHGDLNEEVKQFGNFHHLHPKQIAEIPTELSREVEKMHKALNEEVIQADGTRLLHPKQIAEIPEEVTAKDRELHSELTKEVAYVGGKEILHPKVIAEVPEGLCEEVRYLHEDLNYEVKQIGPNHLHPKQIAEIPAEASPEVRKAQIYLMEEVKTGAQMLHPKEIVEIPADLNQETRDLHKDLNVEVQLFGGASRLQDGEQSLEPPKELAESVKEVLPSLTTEIKEFNGPHKLHYNCIPNQHKEHNGVAPKLDIDSFQTHVEQMLLLYGAADSGLDLSASNKQASGNPVLDECVESVVSALIQAAKKLRGPLTDTDVLVEELHRRRSIIDVEDSAPAKEQPKQVSQDDNGKPLDVEPANDENWTVLEQHDSGQSDQNAKEPVPIPRSETNDDKELKKSKLMRRLSGWKASYATLNDEGGASDPVYAHAKGKEVAKDTDNKNENRQTSPMRKLRWNPFRKHHRQHVDAV